jgi:coenzyme F420 hydrogenase subunit beta
MRLKSVIEGELCSGCGLCAAVLGPERAQMQLRGPGYLRPIITGDVSDAEDWLFEQVCPGSQVHLPSAGSQLAAPEWGPLLSVATGYAADPDLRQRASSGGAISAILEHLLSSSQARYVLQVAASTDTPWLNTLVRSASIDAVRHASGSRYAPSAPLEPIIRCLDEGQPFAVVGKPCDIAALRAYARHDPRVDVLVVAMIAFMCGGIPSASGIEQLVRKMGADPVDVRAFRFRGNGWPGRASALTHGGEEHTLSYNESWGGVLSKHVQLRCKICADGVGMSADLVCADAWYGDESGYPSFEEQDGRSLVLGRTPRGEAVIAAACAAGQLRTEPLDGREIDRMQPYQMRRTRLTLSRLLAMRMLLRPATSYRGMSLFQFARKSGAKANLKSLLGTVARLLRGRM